MKALVLLVSALFGFDLGLYSVLAFPTETAALYRAVCALGCGL